MKKSTNKRNGDEILAKLDALEKAYKELRKVVLDGVDTSAPKKPAPRPSKKFEYKDSTFLYECMDETRNQRLSALYVGLKQLNLIDQRTQQKQFIDLFSGQPLYHRIRWTGGKAQLVHPFMPFITEELWQHIADRKDGESLMVSVFRLDTPTDAEKALIDEMEDAKQIISGVRGIRQTKNISPREPLQLQVAGNENPDEVTHDAALCIIIKKMAGLSDIMYVAQKGDGTSSFLIGTTEYAVPLGALIDVEAEIKKAEAELKHLEGFLAGIQKKLSNERFVNNAPEQVVALERKKASDSLEKIAALKETIKSLKA